MADRERAARAVDELLRALGLDPASPALAETGARVAQAWDDDLLAGMRVDVPALLAGESFPVERASVETLVVLRDSETSTMCPHHLLPALGHATVAYVPGARVAGLGTLARVVDAFAQRLALQEDIGTNVVSALMDGLGARGAACALRLRHTCLSARGERKGAWVETLATAGVLAPGASHAALVAALLPGAPRG